MNPSPNTTSAIHYAVGPNDVRRKDYFVLSIVIALLFGALLTYAEAHAFSWDEGFHLGAARLIKNGERPYLDFCFPQTPLNAYWNALWLSVFGDSWRAIHFIAALVVAASIWLAADFVLRRFPVHPWRLAAALATALLFGLNGAVVIFGTIGQAYALCLLLTVAAFRVAVVAVEKRGAVAAGITGALGSGAAAASLLTAPAVPVLLVWILLYNRAGNRITKLLAFIAGGVIPFLPVIWLYAKSPHLVLFNLFEYHLIYRRSHWDEATEHDIGTLLSWIDSPYALLLALLAAGGLLFLATASGWERARRAEFFLAAWITFLMGAEIATAHPTFTWYFLLIVPFLAIPAAVGIYAAGARLYRPDRPGWPVGVLAFLLIVGFGKAIYDDRDALSWTSMEAIAKKVQEVTPPGASLWASEHIYFLTHRPIPEGMEFQAGLKTDMPMSQAAPLHILPGPELARRVKGGAFSTIASCDDDKIEELGLAQLYAKKEEVGTCTVFWEFTGSRPAGGPLR